MFTMLIRRSMPVEVAEDGSMGGFTVIAGAEYFIAQ